MKSVTIGAAVLCLIAASIVVVLLQKVRQQDRIIDGCVLRQVAEVTFPPET